MHSRKIHLRIVFFIVILFSIVLTASNKNVASAKSSDFQIKNKVLIKYTGTAKDVIIPDGVVTIKHGAFQGNTTIKSITMPNSVTTIDDYPGDFLGGAFAGCTSLTSITFSKNLSYIGSYAFSDCTSLRSVSLPSSLNEIATLAFSGCTSLKSISFPNALSYIGKSAFSGCKSLKSVTLPSELTSIKEETFKNCTSLETVNLSENISLIYERAFEGCISLANITFPPELGLIGDFAFSKCKSLQKIQINKNLDFIGKGAFSYCSNLKYYEVDEDNVFFKVIDGVLYNINESVLVAYPANSKDTKFNIPKSIKIIANYAFSSARNLTTVALTDNITAIYPFTFANCASLKSINFPSSLKVIGQGAFTNCSKLQQIKLPEGLARIESQAFKGCTSLTTYTIPSSLRIVNEAVFEGCTNIKSIVLKEGVELFYGANTSPNLEKITLPKSLLKLDGNQFINTKWYKNSKAGWVYLGKHLIDYKEDKTHIASKVTAYAVKEGTVSINDEAFNNMVRLSKLTVPKTVLYYHYDEDYVGKYDYLKTGSGSNLENTFWYLSQPNGVVYLGNVAFRLKNIYASFLIGATIGTKEEVEINLKKQELYKKHKLITFNNISIKNGTVSITNNFTGGATTTSPKYTFPSSLKLIGSNAFISSSNSIKSIIWSKNLKYIEKKALSNFIVEDYKLYKNFPSNAKVVGDRFLYAALNRINSDNSQIEWMVDDLISSSVKYEEKSETLTFKSNAPYLARIDSQLLFYDDIIIPQEMESIADYLFGYSNWNNPNLKFTTLMIDDEGEEYEVNGVFRKNTKTGKWETVALGNYTNNPFEYRSRDDYRLTWDATIGFWRADLVESSRRDSNGY